MMNNRDEILRLAALALEQYLGQTRKHADDIHDQDAIAALLEVVTVALRELGGPTPVLRLVNRVLAEQRTLIPEIHEAAAEREARAAIAVPNGGHPDMSAMLADLRKALEAAYPDRPKRKGRKKARKPADRRKPLPTWCRGVIDGGEASS
ncbi:hypothetical protein [Magnetospirillum sulfuroxidans]|uniref:Uncharacterized protein n=1 Tax=Magnetospirillum sulfuroxidans TaxID=611300 RepID=A0ABS5IH89_9PROT|nr:hypothetical protein [Magnetospirillum sulfuroxidans]MBR9973795.1 hypothetical protein [Magnetospirillum sulfuroxidans]